jgi:hypothetical protein
MALSQSPKIVTDGLVLYYDMNNTQKSFKGQPITNNYLIPTPAVNGNVTFSNQGTGIFQRITSGNYGGYTIQPTDVVYKYDLGELGCHYHGNSIAVSAGQTYTFSFDYYISANATGYPSTNYLANMECYETSTGTYVFIAGNSVTDPTTSIKGVWKSASFSVTVPSSTTPVLGLSLYPGACGSTRLANTGSILYKNPQVELNNFVSPFVQGTRANTQSIIDLTGQNTLIANNLVYNTNNTFSFINTNTSYVGGTANKTLSFTTGGSMEMVFQCPDFTTRMQGYMQFVGTSSQGGTGYIDLLGNGNGRMRWEVIGNLSASGATSIQNNTNLSNNTWHHIVGTFTNTGLTTIYINGQADGSTQLTNWPTGTITGTPYIGNYFAAASGSIPVAKIYNTCLTATQVQQNFQALRGRYGL